MEDAQEEVATTVTPSPELEEQIKAMREEKQQPVEEKKHKGPMAPLMKKVDELLEKLTSFEDRILKLEATASKDTHTSYEPPTQDDKLAEKPSDSKVVSSAKEILGDGNADRCEFEVTMKTHSADSFRLVIVPPQHLKENATDTRIKVIPYLQGVSGASEYALRVKNFCVSFATKKGINYFAK